MDTLESNLDRAGEAVRALADGPGREAAEALEQAFGRAGLNIEAALSQAARSGELDFARMAQSVLADLARIAAEAAIANAGLGQGGQTVNLNVAGGAGSGPVAGTRTEIAKAITKAAALGARYR